MRISSINEEILLSNFNSSSFVQDDIFATAIVLSVESEEAMGVGLQIDTRKGPAQFVYPYHQEEDKWVTDKPSQAEMLIAPRVFG